MPPTRRVLGYARVSSAEQALGTSLSDQQDVIRRHAEGRGLKVTRFFVEAESAIHEKIERRDQMRALMADVRRGDLVLCDKLDRWSRDPEYTYGSVRKILEAGASFYAVGDACDPSTSEGDTMLGFRVLFAREEHKRIKQRMVGTRNLLQSRGYYASGTVPLGYRRATDAKDRLSRNVLVVVPEEAELVRKIFRMYVGGWSMTKLARELGLTLDRVKDVLHRRTYLGEVQLPPSAPGLKDGEWIRGHHEPIIDADLWARAHETIAARTLGGPRPREGSTAETSSWILRDLARCAHCGSKMGAAYAGPKGDGRRYYYRCTATCTAKGARVNTRSYVPVRDVETAAGPLIVKRLAELKEALSTTRTTEPTRKPAADLDARRAKLQRQREKHLEQHSLELITLEELRAYLVKLDAARQKLDAEESAAKKPSPLADEKARRAALAQVRALAHAWKHATPEEARSIAGHIATAVAISSGAPPRFTWRSAEEMAGSVA